jgi:2-polyprenyl-6-hydroxyphenyl methylase / 3-demethylubiquinone-9 3-methyltransferase
MSTQSLTTPNLTPGVTPSVDPAEVAYFERLAHRWWDTEGPFWPLHRLNAFRVGYIRERIPRALGLDPRAERPLAGLRVLDIGCGGGILSESVALLGAQVLGVDVTEKNLRVARMHAGQSGLPIDYRLLSVADLAESGETFDLVLNMEVVEHVEGLPEFLAACGRLVRPGGVMLVATINRTWAAALIAIFGAEVVLRWLPRGTHHYRKLVRPGRSPPAWAPGSGCSTRPGCGSIRSTGPSATRAGWV